MSVVETLAAMPTEELIGLIRRGLDDDEEAARTATRGPWWVDTPSTAWGEDVDARVSATTDMVATLPHHLNGGLNALHVERHDPSRVLADVQAKRDLMKSALDQKHYVCPDGWYTCSAATEERDGGECDNDARAADPCDCGRDDRVRRTLEALARPYLDRETP